MLVAGVQRLHQLLPDEADRLTKTPFAIVQASWAAQEHAALGGCAAQPK